MQPAIWPARGMSEDAVGESDCPLQCLSACPIVIGGRELVAGSGGSSRLLGLPGDVHYHRRSMAVSATISSLQGSSLCAEGHFSKVRTCVACLDER